MHILNEPWLVRHFVMIDLSHQSSQFLQLLAHQRNSGHILGVHVFQLGVKVPISVPQRSENCLADIFDAP